MPEPRDELILDRLIHEPGNLSSHLTKLEEAGLVEIEKRFIRKKPNTKVTLTAVGKQRIAHHWDQLERLRKLSENTAQQ